MIYGIDIGSYTKKVDWRLLKQKGVEFAIIKATQGDYLVNPGFPNMAEGALAAGLVVGLYHWCDPLRGGRAQAEYFLQKTGAVPFHFAAVDIEQEWADWNEWPGRVTRFLQPEVISRVGKETTLGIWEGHNPGAAPGVLRSQGRQVVVYTRASFVQEYAPGMSGWLGAWPLWVAHWAFNPGRMVTTWEALLGERLPYTLQPALPRGCQEWVFHQWSGDRFVLPGMDNNTVDLNSFRGTPGALRAWAGLTPAAHEEPLPGLLAEARALAESACRLEKALQTYADRQAATGELPPKTAQERHGNPE